MEGGGRETRGRRQGRVKGTTEGRSQRWMTPNRGRATPDKTEKVLFHLSNYIYLSLAHKQTRRMVLTEWSRAEWAQPGRHTHTLAQAHIFNWGMQMWQDNKSKGRKHWDTRRKNMGIEKSGQEMRKAKSGEDSRAKGTSQIDTEKLMCNCSEGCEWDWDGRRACEWHEDRGTEYWPQRRQI